MAAPPGTVPAGTTPSRTTPSRTAPSGTAPAGTALACLPPDRGSRRPGRRDQILATAAAMFARRGFHGVSIDELGAAVGLSGPALYRHFRSKERILSEMLLDVGDRLLASATANAHRAATPGGRLRCLIEAHVAFAVAEPDLVAVQTRDVASLPPDDRCKVAETQDRYADLWIGAVMAVTGADRSAAATGVQAAFGLMNATAGAARLDSARHRQLLTEMAEAALAAVAGEAREGGQ